MMAAISCNYRAGCGSALRQVRQALMVGEEWEGLVHLKKNMLSIGSLVLPWWRGPPQHAPSLASTPWSA